MCEVVLVSERCVWMCMGASESVTTWSVCECWGVLACECTGGGECGYMSVCLGVWTHVLVRVGAFAWGCQCACACGCGYIHKHTDPIPTPTSTLTPIL